MNFELGVMYNWPVLLFSVHYMVVWPLLHFPHDIQPQIFVVITKVPAVLGTGTDINIIPQPAT